jgi:L-fuconate dehydratase
VRALQVQSPDLASVVITRVRAQDARFPLAGGAGSDSVHSDPVYSYAVTRLETDAALAGTGLAFTLGAGNELVCQAIEALGAALVGREIEEAMADFARVWRALADHPQYRWLGPHKGVVHLALASLANACFDLWARARGVPLWRLLLDLEPEATLALCDLSRVEDVLPRERALTLLRDARATRGGREAILRDGYPGYDTSVGWFAYPDEQVRENALRAAGQGFRALKLKVGSDDPARDLRRARIVREAVGPDVRIMLDANQAWSLPRAIDACRALGEIGPEFIEEPLHPDDVIGHRDLVAAIAPLRVALGEHVPNAVLFKSFLQARALHVAQPDCVRLGGVSEFLTVALLCRVLGVPVVPHVGDMGQIHQHLVLWNHVALGAEASFLEHIPHLRERFAEPALVRDGRYRTPQRPGASTALALD